MWLPAARVAPHGGVVHAGEVRGEDGSACAACVIDASLRRSAVGVAVGGAGQAEQPAQRAGLVGGRGTAPRRCSSGTSAVDDRRRGRAASTAGPQPEAVEPGAAPVQQQVGQLAGGAGEDRGVAERTARPSSVVEALPARSRGAGGRRRGTRPGRRRPAAARPPGRPRPARRGPRRRSRGACVGVVRGDEARRRRSGRRSRYGTVEWASAATTGWPCGGRGVIDGPLTLKQRPSKSM